MVDIDRDSKYFYKDLWNDCPKCTPMWIRRDGTIRKMTKQDFKRILNKW